MENNVKFRNHFSVVLENAVKGIWGIVFFFIGSFLANIGETEETRIELEVLALLGVFLAVLVCLFIYQILVWFKTTITIQENTIVVERRTLNRKVNTIGIKNISNVNLEQNVLEMLLGTWKVKLNTDSLSTANETDLAIILKKKDAEMFRQMILNRTQEKEKRETEALLENVHSRRYVSMPEDIALHGVFSIHFLSIVILLGAVILTVAMFVNTLNDPEAGILEAMGTLFVSAGFVAGWLWNIIKNFVKYADFRIERNEDKVFLNYGILKKVTYSIPVDKINAVRLNQTFLARICKYYMVEVINVGMDDEDAEEFSFFLPYSKKEKLKNQLELLLPEFSDCLEIQEEKQPKSIWILWIPMVVIYSMIMAAVFGVSLELAWTYMGDSEGFEWILLGGITILSVLLLISKVGSYFTAGCNVQEEFLKIVTGIFFKQSLFVKYDKIQYMETRQNILAKCCGVERGSINILASAKNQTQIVPYCREEMMEKLRKRIIR